jgi:hypothetical protein
MTEGAPSPPPPPDDSAKPSPPDYSQLPPPPPSDSDFPPAPRSVGTNRYAKASLYFALLGWLICGLGSIMGVYYGFKALAEIKSTGEGGRSMAIAGIGIGFVLFVWGVMIIRGQVNS